MGQNLIRLLKADEIECRIAAINEKGLNLLLYKDARVDQRILDETFGAFGWKRSHQSIDGNLYCTVEILDRETGQWVAKQDVGTTGYAEKEKSQASDSFKRACFNWGIGRELYSAPFIWIPASRVRIQVKEGREKRYFCNDEFAVSSIRYNENREISALVVVNDRGQTVYELRSAETENGSGVEKQKTVQKETRKTPADRGQDGPISKGQMDSLQAELDRTGITMRAVQDRYKIREPEAMGEELYGRVMSALKRTKSVGAA